jgi:hypothetical protein
MRNSAMKEKTAPVYYRDGKIYITKGFERKLFFVLTVMMMIWGVFAKIGLF